MLFVHL